MATKEIAATAPLVVLLYDRTFLSGSLRESLRQRWGFYLALAASWGLLAALVFSTGLFGRGENMDTPSTWAYAFTQPGVVLYYLRLSFWPQPLCLDYGWSAADTPGAVLPGLVGVGLLVAATVWGLTGGRRWGFAGAWFFLILAPSSSVVCLGQLAFEHRMYLSLAGVVTLAVVGAYTAAESPLRRGWRGGRTSMAVGIVAVMAAVVGLGYVTFQRNKAYQDGVGIWQESVAARPGSFRARLNLGNALLTSGRAAEAIPHHEEAVRLRPDLAEPHNNLGFALASCGRFQEAVEHYRLALDIKPDFALVHNNLGFALARSGRPNEAIEHYEQSIRLAPQRFDAYNNLANLLRDQGQTEEALKRYQQAAEINPTSAEVFGSWGNVLLHAERFSEAAEKFEQSLRLKPDYLEMHCNLATALASLGRESEAAEHYQHVLRIRPDFAAAHFNWANLLFHTGHIPEALDHYREALRIQPDFVQACHNRASALVQVGRVREAIEQGQHLLRLTPNAPYVYHFVAWLMATHDASEGGDPAEAVRLAEKARDLAGRPNSTSLDTLAVAYAAAGRFEEAVTAANEARRLAQSASQTAQAQEIHMRLQLYRDHKPYREPAAKSSPSGVP
jgi:tetratricopeptide (TPR) repeat protein